MENVVVHVQGFGFKVHRTVILPRVAGEDEGGTEHRAKNVITPEGCYSWEH